VTDVLFYVADKNIAESVGGLMGRDKIHRIVGCREFSFKVKVAAGQNDPGIYVRASELLRGFVAEHARVVVLLDEEWDGSPGADEIERALRVHLDFAGWTEENSVALVVKPEADVWLWSDSPHSATALGWSSWNELRPALEQKGFLVAGQKKPTRPKEAAEWALSQSGKPRSSTLYRQVSSQVAVRRCEDDALTRLLTVLCKWFPSEGA
jgi:hypothetical protein